MEEIWLAFPIEGFPDYEVSNHGRVRSKARTIRYSTGGIRNLDGKILKPIRIGTGYFHCNVWKDRKMKMFSIHRLVALAFLLNPEGKRQVNHKDFNKANNRLDNLEWATPKENTDHANLSKGQKRYRGDEHKSSKITDAQVAQIRHLRKTSNITMAELAKMFGISQPHVSQIISLQKRFRPTP